MGQKTHPYGFRLGVIKPWRSRYYARRNFPELLKEDDLIRRYLKTRLSHAAIADVHIERRPGKVTVTVHTGRPGVVIGKRGAEVDKLRDELAQLTGKEVGINVEEIKRPELDAQLVGDSVVHQMVHLTTNTDWRLAWQYLNLGNSPRSDGILPMSVSGEIEASGGLTIPDWSLLRTSWTFPSPTRMCSRSPNA